MNIPLEKWLVMLVLTVISIILGLVPYILVRYTTSMLPTDSKSYKLLLTILSCFGGGVLFSTSLLHLLPEVREGLEGNPEVWETFDEHFPLAEVVVLGGFCLIYLVEEVAHFIMVDGHHGHHHHMDTVARQNSIAHALPIPNTKHVKGTGTLSITPRSSIISLSRSPSQKNKQNNPSICVTSPSDVESNSNNNDLSVGGYPIEPRLPSIMDEDGQSDLELGEECPDDQSNFTSSLRTFLALVALSFHAIMEGVAIGLQNSSNVWVMFGAVASHKFVISFCMGMELVASQTKSLTYFSSIIFFAVISPVGIIIGSLLASDDSTKSVSVTVIEGIACGTLLYVVFFEILNRERERKSYSMSDSKAIGFIQLIALVVGLVGMGVLVTLTHGAHSEDDHGQEEDGDSHEHIHSHSHSPSYDDYVINS